MALNIFNEPVLESLNSHQALISLCYIAGGIIAGIAVEKLVISRLKKLALKTKWEGDDIIIDAFHSLIIWLGVLIGFYSGLKYLPFTEYAGHIINSVFKVLSILWATILVTKILVGFIRHYSHQDQGLIPSTSILVNITRVSCYIVGILLALESIHISITPLLTALGIGGLAIALALQGPLTNLFAGIQILGSKNLRIGDYIRLDNGDEGYITDITWRSTTIRALTNRIIVVPNSTVITSIVKNFSLPDQEIPVPVDIVVTYQSDLEKVEKISVEVAKQIMQQIPGAISGYDPVIRFNKIGESGVSFSVIMRAKTFADQYLIIHEFIKAIYKRYREEGIEIGSPVRMVKMKN